MCSGIPQLLCNQWLDRCDLKVWPSFACRYLIASHTTDYQHPMLFLNTLAVFVMVVAKFPHMHKVRIFGINGDQWKPWENKEKGLCIMRIKYLECGIQQQMPSSFNMSVLYRHRIPTGEKNVLFGNIPSSLIQTFLLFVWGF